MTQSYLERTKLDRLNILRSNLFSKIAKIAEIFRVNIQFLASKLFFPIAKSSHRIVFDITIVRNRIKLHRYNCESFPLAKLLV